jgi:hypothetical protein
MTVTVVCHLAYDLVGLMIGEFPNLNHLICLKEVIGRASYETKDIIGCMAIGDQALQDIL